MYPSPFLNEFQRMQEGDVGTNIILTIVDQQTLVPINLTQATGLQIIAQLPDGTQATWTANLWTNGADGNIYYTTKAAGMSTPADINQSGYWVLQGVATVAGGQKTSHSRTMRVFPNVPLIPA